MKKHLILGECKWIKERGKAAILKDLIERKTAKVVPSSGKWQVYFLGFSREGWNENAAEYARKQSQILPSGKNWQMQGIRLLTLDDVDKDLSEWANS